MRYRTFAEAPVAKPFPPTGSLFYRCGAFDGRSMTLKEQWFEQFVNEMQAREDVSRDLKEWERRKNHEKKAILLYQELGENLQDFATQMAIHDQQEFEYQCQRDKQKAENLDPNNKASRLSWARLQEWAMKEQAEKEKREAAEKAMEQARIKSNFAALVKARIQASEDRVTHSEIITNAAGSQPPTQQPELKQSKPEKHGKASQSVGSTGAGPSKQQVRKTGLSDEEVRRQLREQVQASLAVKTKTQATATQTANERSTPLRTDSLTPLRVETLDVAVLAAGEEPIKAELAGYYPRMGILSTTHYPKGDTLIKNGPGLPMLYLASSNAAKQSPLRNNGQGCNAFRNHTVTESTEQSSTGPSTQQNSSEESTPPSSVRPASSETPIENALDALSISTIGPTNDDDQNEGLDHVNLLHALEADLYGEVNYPARWNMMNPSTRRNPLLSTPSSANALSV